MSYEMKDPKMKAFLDRTSKKLFGREVGESISRRVCVSCGRDVPELDAPDECEYGISGLCPHCYSRLIGEGG